MREHAELWGCYHWHRRGWDALSEFGIGKHQIPGKSPALALQTSLCISVVTAEELFLVALAFAVTLKRNGLLAPSLFFLFTIAFFPPAGCRSGAPRVGGSRLIISANEPCIRCLSAGCSSVSGWAVIIGVIVLLG